MKAVHPSYTFVSSTKTITLTGLNIDQDQLLLIVNATRGVQYFNFADSSLRGTVTPGANTTVVLTDASTTGHSNSDALVIYYDDQAAVQAVSGTVTANPGTGAFTVSGTVGLDANSLSALENITVTVGPAISGTVTISNFPASQNISGTVTANGGEGTFLIGGLRSGSKNAILLDAGTGYLQTKVESMPAISGTVSATVTIGAVSQGCFGATIQGYDTLTGVSFGNCVPVKLFEDSTGLVGNVAGTVTANISTIQLLNESIPFVYEDGGTAPAAGVAIVFGANGDSESLAVSDVNPLPVTANNPSGALTTRFGSVTTANTAQLTSAVTNTSRKYLLVQNIATSTVTIGIGFAPTTTQGIQLTAGAGLTFDAFCPTGGVWWLSSTTGSNFSILEG